MCSVSPEKLKKDGKLVVKTSIWFKLMIGPSNFTSKWRQIKDQFILHISNAVRDWNKRQGILVGK